MEPLVSALVTRDISKPPLQCLRQTFRERNRELLRRIGGPVHSDVKSVFVFVEDDFNGIIFVADGKSV